MMPKNSLLVIFVGSDVFFPPSPYMRAQMCCTILITSWPLSFKSRQEMWLKEEENSDKTDNKRHENNVLLLRVT